MFIMCISLLKVISYQVEDRYIVFETNQFSQYGLIYKQKKFQFNPVNKKKVDAEDSRNKQSMVSEIGNILFRLWFTVLSFFK